MSFGGEGEDTLSFISSSSILMEIQTDFHAVGIFRIKKENIWLL